MAFGILDTRYIDFPTGVDASYLAGLQNRDGLDFARIIRELDAQLGDFNGQQDSLVLSLIAPPTTQPYAQVSGRSAFRVERRAEYTVPRPQIVERAAVMIPVYDWDVSLGFTEDGLLSMSLDAMLDNVGSVLDGFRLRHRTEVLKRLFSIAEVSVDAKTTTTSPGFAGSGTGSNVFSRPFPDGTALPGGYSLYFAVGASTLALTLKAARDALYKWYPGPYDLIAPQAQIDLITAIAPGDPANGFVSAGNLLVRPPQANAQATVDVADYLGVLFGDIRVHRAIVDTASANIAIYKTFGQLSPANPLAWRYDALKGRDVVIRSREMFPLDQAIAKQSFGVGVSNRVAAALIKNGTAPYTDPVWTND